MEYKLLGTVKVREDKKAELNEYVLSALYKGGIRKTCEVVLDGAVYTTIKPAVPNENCIVFFDYSIFERKKREPGQYNMEDCSLEVHDRQNNEYGLVMNIIMFLQEIYSEAMCLLMEDEVPMPYPDGYRRLIKGLLGVEFYPEKRTKPREMLHFLKESGLGEIEVDHILDGMISDWYYDKELLKKEVEIIDFYRVILRKNENEFLEYWDGENLILSDNMQEYIDDWKAWFKDITVPVNLNMEKELAQIAKDMQDNRNAYLDYAFVKEFMDHREQDDYKKAILLFKMTKERDCKWFPELTVTQAYEWMVKPNRNAEDKIAARAYQALLINKKQRKSVLGF